MNYFDTTYLVRLYLEDHGFPEVRELGAGQDVACCLHGRAEVLGAFHCQFREGRIDAGQLSDLMTQFETDSEEGAFLWLPLDEDLVASMSQRYRTTPRTTFLRAADALHLACASGHSFTEVYSNDRHLLAAAPLFGLKGINVIGNGNPPEAPGS